MKNIVIILFTVILLSSCSSLQIISDYDKTVDFTTYKTYTFLPWNENNSKMVGPYGQRRIYMALRNELNSRGYVEDENNPDLAISPLVIIEEKTGTTAYTNYYNPGGYYGYYGYGYGGWGVGMGYSTTTYSDYTYLKGTLLIDMFDTSKKELIWQGGAVGEVEDDRHRGDKEKERKTNIIMKRVFSQFPVKPAK
jgi:hypothetical protein